jgi:hypothetical protein
MGSRTVEGWIQSGREVPTSTQVVTDAVEQLSRRTLKRWVAGPPVDPGFTKACVRDYDRAWASITAPEK